MNLLGELRGSFPTASVRRVSIGDICAESTSRNKLGQASEVRSVTNKRGLVLTTDYFENARTSVDTTNYKIVSKNMFVYNPSRINIGSIAWHKEDSSIAVSPMYVVFEVDMEEVLPEYLMLFLESSNGKQQILNKCEVGARFRLPYDSLSRISLTLPPLNVQQEIINVLKKFTSLESELEAELEARNSQYMIYRRDLLSNVKGGGLIKESTLGEISVKVSSGSTPLANSPRFYEGGTIPWLRTQEVRFNEIRETEIKVTETALRETGIKWIPENCVIIAISGATAGRSAINKIPLTTNQHCCNFQIDSSKADYRYVFHWVASKYEEIKSFGRGVRSDLSSGQLKQYPIYLPPLKQQIEIAALLDKFDHLINDVSAGLPAEIAVRRKQYEHYRNRLLNYHDLESL